MSPITSKLYPRDFEIKISTQGGGMQTIQGSDWLKSLIVSQLKQEVKSLNFKAVKVPLLLDAEDQTLELTVRRYLESSINTLLPILDQLINCKNQIHNNQL